MLPSPCTLQSRSCHRLTDIQEVVATPLNEAASPLVALCIIPFYQARALRALGLLLADGAPTVHYASISSIKDLKYLKM